MKRFEIKYLVVRAEIKEEQTIIRTAKLQVGLNMSMIGSIRIWNSVRTFFSRLCRPDLNAPHELQADFGLGPFSGILTNYVSCSVV